MNLTIFTDFKLDEQKMGEAKNCTQGMMYYVQQTDDVDGKIKKISTIVHNVSVKTVKISNESLNSTEEINSRMTMTELPS